MNPRRSDIQQNINPKTKYQSTKKFINEMPDIPVECKHIRTEINLNDFETFQPIQMEDNISFGLTENSTFGLNIDLSLPEVNFVPNIENYSNQLNVYLPGDEELFNFNNQSKGKL